MKLFVAFGGLLMASSAMSVQFFDNFNRADASDLGPNWVNMSGTIGISGGMAVAPTQAWNLALVNGYSDTPQNTTITFDVFHGQQSVTFAAAVLGYLDISTSAHIKVQDNGLGGTYNRAFFYLGNGNSNLTYYDLTPFQSARIRVGMVGTVAVLDIDTDFNGTIDQTYSYDYVGYNLGTGAGLGAYGDGKIDNYNINGAVPEPMTLAVVGIGLLGFARRKRA